MTIPSPYYFIPLSEHIFFPDWAARASMDVPFRHGISGSITVRVTAETSMYIRNTNGEKNSEESFDFFRVIPEGKYAINGTSFKGMLRSIIEVISFSRFSQIDPDRYMSYRDLYSDQYKQKMISSRYSDSRGTNVARASAEAGWLFIDEQGEWKIEKQKQARVEIEDLEEYHQLKAGHNPGIMVKATQQEKYLAWKIPLEVKFSLLDQTVHNHDCSDECNCRKKRKLSLEYAKVGKLGTEHGTTGTIVFTGRLPIARKKQKNYTRTRHSKHMDFIFYTDGESEIVTVPDEVKKKFKEVYSDVNGNALGNWEYWQPKLKASNERIPVFYLENDDGLPEDIGLSQMFKLPYTCRVRDLVQRINPDHLRAVTDTAGTDPALDLAQTMFGRESGTCGLRGRINIEPLLAVGSPVKEKRITAILSTPRNSFFPNYLEQDVDDQGKIRGRYKTYNDTDARPGGRKAFPARESCLEQNEIPSGNTDMETAFCPLPAGTSFTGEIFVHNILPGELGALLWALTWGGDSHLRHVIGMAKPYGFGTVNVEICAADLHHCSNKMPVTATERAASMQQFTEIMEEWHRDQVQISSWEESPQLRELRMLANPANHTEMNQNLCRYPQAVNKFADYKKNRLALLHYSRQIRR